MMSTGDTEAIIGFRVKKTEISLSDLGKPEIFVRNLGIPAVRGSTSRVSEIQINDSFHNHSL